MKGQVFTVAKLHYFNGVVYEAAKCGVATIKELALKNETTTKSGNAKHPETRVRTLARFAEGFGLVSINNRQVEITDFGRVYFALRDSSQQWVISEQQKSLLRDSVQNKPKLTPTLFALLELLKLVDKGLTGSSLEKQYAIAIGKEDAWNSQHTYEGFTKFGVNYLAELGFIEASDKANNWIVKHYKPRTNARLPKTILFTWNPDNWEWVSLPQAISEANSEDRHIDDWNCGSRKDIAPGDRAFLIKLGVPPKGIIGSGVIVSDPYKKEHWDEERAAKGDEVTVVDILFDVLSRHPLVTEDQLGQGLLSKHDWFPRSSGTQIPKNVVEALEEIWTKITDARYSPVDQIPSPNLRNEGTSRTRLVTTYERNTKAREECLLHHKPVCKVCGMSFEEVYGELGKGFIHVHHIVPVSQIGKEYKVNPIMDLAPVCPNCHAMLHMGPNPVSIEELKVILER